MAAEVCRIGREAGLDAVGVATAEPFTDARIALEERKAAGLHGGMQFTYRNPERSTDPAATLAGARSLVVGALRYSAGAGAGTDGRPAAGSSPLSGSRPTARVARYATVDRYTPLRDALGEVARALRAEGWKAMVVADENGMVDRAAAHRAGLGWFGKNANLLIPGQGSWFVLGTVITDAELEPTASAPVADGCGPCTRCLTGCPTGAIVAPGVVDARRCLAWLVQQPGSFPPEHREALGDRLYGCDDCQEVCPPSRVAGAGAEGAGGAEGGAVGPADGSVVDVLDLLGASDEELLRRHGRWYIADRDPDQLRRNALIVLGNVGELDDPLVAAAVARFATHPKAWVREVAEWAASRLAARAGATRA